MRDGLKPPANGTARGKEGKMTFMTGRRRRLLLAPMSLLCVVSGLLSVPARAQDAPKVAGTEVPAPKRTKTVLPEYPPEARAGRPSPPR